MKYPDICCRWCIYFDIAHVKDKAGRVQSNKVAQCTWTLPPLPVAFAYWGRRLTGGLMTPYWGTECLCFERRNEEGDDVKNT